MYGAFIVNVLFAICACFDVLVKSPHPKYMNRENVIRPPALTTQHVPPGHKRIVQDDQAFLAEMNLMSRLGAPPHHKVHGLRRRPRQGLCAHLCRAPLLRSAIDCGSRLLSAQQMLVPVHASCSLHVS